MLGGKQKRIRASSRQGARSKKRLQGSLSHLNIYQIYCKTIRTKYQIRRNRFSLQCKKQDRRINSNDQLKYFIFSFSSVCSTDFQSYFSILYLNYPFSLLFLFSFLLCLSSLLFFKQTYYSHQYYNCIISFSCLPSYIFIHMLTEPNFSTSSSYQPKRIRKFSAEIQDQSNVPRKRQTKTVEDDINPYEAIPELPHVKMTLADMKGDPIQFFMKLEEKYNKFGAVKVSACSQWKCPFQQRFVDRGITTRIQHLSKLKHGKAFEQNVEAYTLHSYQAYALNFEKTYKYKTQPRGKTAQGRKQYEYWSLVTKHEYEKSNVKVQYAADLASLKYGSGFPIHHDPRNQDQHFSYDTNLFNLNNIMNSPTSLLGMSAQRKQKVSGITHPWVYMGSMFSSFCWHVQDLGVNSLNYNHKGGIKTWYVVPGAYKQNFDNYVKSTYCTNNHKQTLLDRITFMIDPLELIKVGIPVYKSHQRPHDFICTFFFSYHCGFSQGYNIGEAVNFLSSNSIEPMKKVAKQKKSHQKSPPNVIPVDWVVYENYKRIKTFANGEKIKEAYSVMINQQKKQLKQAKDLFVVDTLCIFPAQKKYDRVYCNVCKQYLYLRAYQLQEDDKVYCFDHLKKLKPQNKKINLMVRQPSDERRYIYDQFKEAKIEIEIDDTPAQKKQKSKSIPRGM